MASQAALGKQALANSKFEEAIMHYSLALQSSPTSPDYLIQRSTAYQRAQKYAEALEDAERAVVNAQKRAKRELIVESQYRRGCALYNLGRYGDAELVLNVVMRMNKEHKLAAMWVAKTKTAMGKLEADDERRRCTVVEIPEVDAGPRATSVMDIGNSGAGSEAGSTNGTPALTNSPTPASDPVPAAPAPPQQTPVDKIRYDWYQNNNNIYFTLLAKGVPKDKAQIDITDRSLTISFPLLTGASYDLTLDPLFAAVKPAECITRVMPTKVEIVLVKAMSGQKWSALESNEPVLAAKSGAEEEDGKDDADAIKRAILAPSGPTTKPTGPLYPTSSKSGPKDWDKISSDLSKADSASKPGHKPGHREDDDDEGGDASNDFFKKLFKDATPEVQRAMMKSYTESNGTALSTNWDEVKKGPVETSPPDGMEARKW
ncbi:hypothetical protein LTR08_007267 [Meristemomyces frigidus]|nr:hypothetical protein LTR08_007267 [Meristemomyces frigidus]